MYALRVPEIKDNVPKGMYAFYEAFFLEHDHHHYSNSNSAVVAPVISPHLVQLALM